MRNDIIQSLHDLCYYLANTFDINCGGCCFLAYELAKHLDQLNIKYNLIIADLEDKDEEYLNKEVINKRQNYYNSCTGENTSNHYFLEIDNEYINGDGFDNGDYNIYKIHDINYKHIKWIYDGGVWNPRYNTKLNKFIHKLINLHFKQYEQD